MGLGFGEGQQPFDGVLGGRQQFHETGEQLALVGVGSDDQRNPVRLAGPHRLDRIHRRYVVPVGGSDSERAVHLMQAALEQDVERLDEVGGRARIKAPAASSLSAPNASVNLRAICAAVSLVLTSPDAGLSNITGKGRGLGTAKQRRDSVRPAFSPKMVTLPGHRECPDVCRAPAQCEQQVTQNRLLSSWNSRRRQRRKVEQPARQPVS